MLGDQFKFLAWFYVNPRKAASAVLDRGQMVFAVVAAALVTLAISLSADQLRAQEYSQLLLGTRAEWAAIGDSQPELNQKALEVFERANRQSNSRYFAASFKALVLVSIVFVPVCILILTAWAHLGGGLTILFRDYMPVLAGLLFAWTAAHLPIALIWFTGLVTSTTAIPVQAAGLLYFLVLAAPVLSTVMGVGLGQAATASLAGFAATAAAGLLFVNSGNLVYMLASPWLLYYGYQAFGRDIRALGGGLSARQSFKRQLEFATLNPRDADAHYQLGLVYLQRRALAEAEASFRRALEIDPHEPDTLFQLGRLLRQKGQDVEARTLLERGAELDPKLASHQVWRELGAVALATGSATEALVHLERYVNMREYDPEGLVLYGRALRAVHRTDEARAAFERAIEAVKTAPKFRRGELAPWEKQARQELKG